MTVAETILSQLGGRKFLAMTGARNLLASANSLSFKLPRFAGCPVTHVIVTLTAHDDYTVEFFRIGRRIRSAAEPLARVEGVYCDNLRAVFTAETGLATSL